MPYEFPKENINVVATAGTDRYATPTWREVYDVINSGAFAVLLSGALVGSFLWKLAANPLRRYVETQIDVSRKMQETIASNSDTLKTMAHNNAEVSKALTQLSTRQDKVEETLTAMREGVPAIVARQRRQVQLLQDIANHIKLPMPVKDVSRDPDDDDV